MLLCTPLIRSLRRAWPDATIDALVFADTAGILRGDPDLNGVVTMPAQPTVWQGLALAARLYRKYDLAISTQSSDRPTFFAFVAGRMRVGPHEDNFNGRLKRLVLRRSLTITSGVHRVEENLRLADLLGIARVSEVVCPRGVNGSGLAWRSLCGNPRRADISLQAMDRERLARTRGRTRRARAIGDPTGGSAEAERRYLDDVWNGAPVTRRDGQLEWPQLAALLSKARVFIGPDTSVTHLAAAAGCPTIALYGPTDPRLWGPWPVGGLETIWAATGTIQHRGNVWLVQNALPCTPCQLEGCERRLDSYSQCLDELSPRQVIAAVDQALAAAKR